MSSSPLLVLFFFLSRFWSEKTRMTLRVMWSLVQWCQTQSDPTFTGSGQRSTRVFDEAFKTHVICKQTDFLMCLVSHPDSFFNTTNSSGSSGLYFGFWVSYQRTQRIPPLDAIGQKYNQISTIRDYLSTAEQPGVFIRLFQNNLHRLFWRGRVCKKPQMQRVTVT